MVDIFEFWSHIGRGERVHPFDQDALTRIAPDKHGFNLECLPAAFGGRLRTAPVVLLFLSPGLAESDLADANSDEGKDYYERRWKGDEPMRDLGGGRATSWMANKTKKFGNYDVVKDKIALLNIGAYHSKDVKSYASLTAIPSSRMSLDWAQNVLFPAAEKGDRIVICMRSAAYWGLETGRCYGKSLFAPRVNRQGHFLKNEENEALAETVRARLHQ